MWAGAADCDTSKGFYVGTLDLSYLNGEIVVTYNTISNVYLDAVHLYIGNDKYPIKSEISTVSSGQFPYKDDPLPSGTSTYTFTITDISFSGDVYIIAHADVVGIEVNP